MAARSGGARDPASYRDPSGFVFRRSGVVYRHVDVSFAAEWDSFVSSGLAATLVADGLLLPFEVVSWSLSPEAGSAHAVIRPDRLHLITYPYEWTVGQLRDAALLTLDVQDRALASGFTLRDASAFNVQFLGPRPILIDHLSLEPVDVRAPWVAYRQFCEHFLAPLALAFYHDPRLMVLLGDWLEGIPLEIVSSLLPRRTMLSSGLLTHLHLHARAQRRFADQSVAPGAAPPRSMSLMRHQALVASLRGAVGRLGARARPTTWSAYAENTSYTPAAQAAKDAAVRRMLGVIGGRTAIDLGANTGRYTTIAASLGYRTVAVEADHGAAERLYGSIREGALAGTQLLVSDLANPAPARGWALTERSSALDRLTALDADVVMALALIHHLAIGRNVPLDFVADLLARLGRQAIVEFVPREDPMTGRLLSCREDIFLDYSIDGFRAAMGRAFDIVEQAPLPESRRTLFCLRRRTDG